MVDAIAAIVILGVALPPLVASFAEGAVQSIRPTYATTAAFLATERMEQIVAIRNQTGGYAQVSTANFANENPVSGYTNYNRSVAITDIAADLTTPQAGSGLRKVTVTVQWSSGAKQVQVSRLFTNY